MVTLKDKLLTVFVPVFSGCRALFKKLRGWRTHESRHGYKMASIVVFLRLVVVDFEKTLLLKMIPGLADD